MLMKAIAYNIKADEKRLLVRANAKRHKLTMISNGLNEKTCTFSVGKEVVIISQNDFLCFALLSTLQEQGIRKVITRSHSIQHIDYQAAEQLGIKILRLENDLNPEESAWQIIDLLSL